MGCHSEKRTTPKGIFVGGPGRTGRTKGFRQTLREKQRPVEPIIGHLREAEVELAWGLPPPATAG